MKQMSTTACVKLCKCTKMHAMERETVCVEPCLFDYAALAVKQHMKDSYSTEQRAILQQPLCNDRDIEGCNCYYCQTQIETHNLPDSSYQLSLSKKTDVSAAWPQCRELSVDTQSNWRGSRAVWAHSKGEEMSTWSERFYVYRDDLISRNVCFIAHQAINLHGGKSKCDIFI